MKPILYSTGCPLCNVLRTKLVAASIEFEEVNDVKVMEQKGMQTAPALEVDGDLMKFGDAVKWVNEHERAN